MQRKAHHLLNIAAYQWLITLLLAKRSPMRVKEHLGHQAHGEDFESYTCVAVKGNSGATDPYGYPAPLPQLTHSGLTAFRRP